MTNLNRLSKALLAVSFLGFVDAAYLTIQHFANSIPPCTIGGCETVLTSPYAEILGIPIALLGALYYIAIFFLVLSDRRRIFTVLVSAGFAVSLILLGLQLFVIRALCLYCIFSLVTSTALFILALLASRHAIQAAKERP